MKKKQLSEKETVLLTIMTALFSGFNCNGGLHHGWNSMLCNAWDINRKTTIRKFNTFVEHGFSVEQKDRSDKGTSVFTCDKKRANTFTAFNVYKKQRMQGFCDNYQRIPEEILKNDYQNLPDDQKQVLAIMAEQNLECLKTLWDELKVFLLRTKGKVTFECMALYLGNIVSANCIRKFLMLQEGFKMRKDRLLPHLDAAAKEQRVVWCHTFWKFWKSVKAVPVTKMRFVLVHMDEKWFYTVRTRTNCKVLTLIGLDPIDYHVQHKLHIGKEMNIVCTAFVLDNNDITRGGKAVPVACVRVGRMVTASKDSYKQVYRDDGSFHYPKIPANLLRR
jgi:hypothetical protein